MSEADLNHTTDESAKSGLSISPANLPASFSIDEASLLKAIEDPTNADKLAQILKNHQVRDCLRERGIKFLVPGDEYTPNDKRLGFYSLPRELRDQVREDAIDLMREDWRTPTIARLACVDTEWRDAIEAVTFNCLGLEATEFTPADLPLFEAYLVGKRRQHLKHLSICLKVRKDMLKVTTDKEFEISKGRLQESIVSSLRNLFSILSRWDATSTENGTSQLDISIIPGHFPGPLELEKMMMGLPTVPVITGFSVSPPEGRPFFCWPKGELIDIRAMFALHSRMPNLHLTNVEFDLFEWIGSRVIHLPRDDADTLIQGAFDRLIEVAPKLEVLNLKSRVGFVYPSSFLRVALEYAQRLHSISLDVRCDIRALLTPFWDRNFEPESPPKLTWPQLTHLEVDRLIIPLECADPCGTMHRMLIAVGRSLKHMPRLQVLNLDVAWGHGNISNFFLECSKGDKVALLSIHHYMQNSIHHPTDEVPKGPPSEVLQVLRESIKHVSDASLEVHIVQDVLDDFNEED